MCDTHFSVQLLKENIQNMDQDSNGFKEEMSFPYVDVHTIVTRTALCSQDVLLMSRTKRTRVFQILLSF